LKTLGTGRLLAMGIVAVGLVAFFIFMTTRLNSTDMAMLYGDLASADSSKIVTQLQAMGIPYEVRGNGKQIFVPSDRVLGLRMTVAQEGLPSGGSVGYEIFDRSEGLGTTSFVQNVNLLRALEGELARSIRTLQQIQEARVHVVLPKRELFSRQAQEPSASVVVKIKGNGKLPKTQVVAIQSLVAASVPGLKTDRISVIDSHGRLLARAGGDDERDAVIASNNEDHRRDFEERMVRTVEELLEQSVGIGRVRAQVAVELDFDRISTSTETFDPDGQVVRSTQTVNENARNGEAESQSGVSVQNNLPDAQSAGGQTKTQNESARTEETVNYEISKTVRSHVRESGVVRKLSVAVLVDGTYKSDEQGATTYQPRTKEDLDKLTALVKSAIGFDAKRGDTVELINMQFAVPTEKGLEEKLPLFGLTKGDYFRIGEIFVLAMVGILVILLVVRPLVARTLDALPSALEAARERALLADQSEETPALTGPKGAGVSGTNQPAEDDIMIDLEQVEGRVRASTLKKISEIVERHPEETVGIIRQWMYAES
jgi:flagellar M-ring protein FliF